MKPPTFTTTGADCHFAHGAAFSCLLCFLENADSSELVAARESIRLENVRAKEQGGLELKLLMDKRALEEVETLLLLCSNAFAAYAKAETVYVYYYLLCSQLMHKAKFKRYRDTHSYNSLRRKLKKLREIYGGASTVLQEISRHPMNKVAGRSVKILQILERKQLDRAEKVLEVVVEDVGVRSDRGRNSWADAGKRRREVVDGKESDASGTWIRALEVPQHAAQCEDFYYHHLQQYDERKVDLCELHSQAFKVWIPRLEKATEEEKATLVHMLKSLLFISIKEKQKLEALSIAKVLLRHISKEEDDHWRFQAYADYLADDMDTKSFTCDLYQKFVDHLTFNDQQIYLSLKFEVLVKYSRFAVAKEIADIISIPNLGQNLSVWIRLLECRLTVPFIHSDRAAIHSILQEQVVKMCGPAFAPAEDSPLSHSFTLLVASVATSYPIHLSFLTKLGALFVIIVCGFDGRQAAEETRKSFERHGLAIPISTYADRLISSSLLAFEAGNFKLTQRLGLAYLQAVEGNNEEHEDAWQVWSVLGQLEASRHNPAQAVKYLERALKLVVQARGKSNSYAFCLLTYAHVLYLQGRLYVAERLNKRALQIFRSNRCHANSALGLFAQAQVLWKSQAWEAAIQLLNESEGMVGSFRGRDKRHQPAAIYTALAFSHYECGNMEDADRYQQKLFAFLDHEKYGTDSATIVACRQCSTWKEWVDTLKEHAPNYLDLVSFLIYPGPSTGADNMSLDSDEAATLQAAWTVLTDNDEPTEVVQLNTG